MAFIPVKIIICRHLSVVHLLPTVLQSINMIPRILIAKFYLKNVARCLVNIQITNSWEKPNTAKATPVYPLESLQILSFKTAPSTSLDTRGHVKSNCIQIKTNKEISEKSSLPTFMLTNACHITNKIGELRGVASNNNPDVVLITESWLSSSIPDSAITIGNEYIMFRRDRSTPGGRVLAYVHHTIPVSRLTTAEDGKEVLWLLLKPPRIPRPFSSIIACSQTLFIYDMTKHFVMS